MAEASAESKSTGGPPSPGGRSPRNVNNKNNNDNPTSGSNAELVGTTNTGESTLAIQTSLSIGTSAVTTNTVSGVSSNVVTGGGPGGSTTSGITGINSKIIGNSSPRSPKHPRRLRIKLTEQQLESATREELAAKWREQDLYVECLEAQAAAQEGELACLRDSEEKYRQQCCEVSHRERILVRRLASKEQQLLGYVKQITEMRASSEPSASALRSALLDPAVNILVQKLRQELLSTKAKLEDTQNELSAWKFTPDSNTGKRLMAKCRLLYQENEELGRMIASGRIAKLEGELALQKSFSEEVKKSQSELDEFLQDLDEDVEGMQSTIYFLQQELRKARESVSLLQQENNTFKSISVSATTVLSASQSVDNNLSNGLSTMHTVTIKKEETTNVSDSRVSADTKIDVDSSEAPPQILPSLPSAQLARTFDETKSEFSDRLSRRANEPDESSNDSAALIIKVENEELSDREDDDDDDEEENNADDDDQDEDDDDDDGDDENEEETSVVNTCENRGPQRQSMRTKERNAMTTKNESVIVGKSNGDEKTSSRTSSRRLVRDRTAKRDKSAADSDDERRQHKKKRRESILSLDYNEDDALILTNGESIQSDPEDGP